MGLLSHATIICIFVSIRTLIINMLKRLTVSFVILLSSIMCRAEWSDNFLYSYYTRSNGLCDEYVLSTFRDSDGFLWVCTSNGLDRFDGYRFMHFSTKSDSPFTKTNDDFFYNVAEDKWGRIWLSSNSGMSIIDKKKKSIVCPDELGDFPAELSTRVLSVYNGSDNELYVLTAHSIAKIVFEQDGSVEKVMTCDIGPFSPRCMTLFQNGIVVGGISGVLFYAFDGHGGFRPTELLSSLSEIKNVSCLLAHGDNLWIGTENGLFCFSMSNGKLSEFRHSDSDPSSIMDSHVTCLALNNSSDLLIGTTSGIDMYTRLGGFLHMRQDRRFRSINSNYINHITVDCDGTMWVGTLVGGLNRITPKEVMFRDMLVVENGESNVISSCFEDEDGNMLVGILGKGLAVKVRNSSDFRFYSLVKTSGALKESVSSIERDISGNYWIGTRYDGLICIPKDRLDHPVFINYNTSNSEILADHILDMVYDDVNNQLWFSSFDALYTFDVSTHECKRIELSTDAGNFWLYSLAITENRTLLAGGYGLFEVDISAPRHDGRYDIRYFPRLEQSEGQPERIGSIVVGADGKVYVGSHNGDFYQISNGVFSRINLGAGINVGKINSLITDTSGDVWIGSSDGVYRYRPDTGITNYYNNGFGLLPFNCYKNSVCGMSGNKIAFGTSNGVVVFETDYAAPKKNDRAVRIVGESINGELNPWPCSDVIDIYPSSPSFELVLSTLDLSFSEKVAFSYKLGREGTIWNYSRDGVLPFSNIKPGKYTLWVRCTEDDGRWSEPFRVTEIDVHPEFTQTFLFRMLVVVIILGLVGLFVFRKMRQKTKIQKMLKLQVEEKTEELKAAIDRVTESKASLEHQNAILEEQKSKLEEYSVCLEQSNKEKLMMYTNITHEFKTPLSLIIGPLDEVASKVKAEEEKSLLDIAVKNSKYLLELVNQILDLRKVDSGNLVLKREYVDVTALSDGFFRDCLCAFEQRSIVFEKNLRLVSGTIISDKDAIIKILSNLLSNAMKYTPDGGRVTMNVAQFCSSANKGVQYFSVTNSGSFISEEERERVFDCYYKSEKNTMYGGSIQGNSGIGLYLVKNIVLALGGRISLKSSKEIGTSFRLIIPVEFLTDDSFRNIEDLSDYEEKDNDMPMILIVEDNNDMRRYIKSILRYKFRIIEATNGQIGYEMAKKHFPDMIISDMMMPVCDGLEFCRMIREDGSLCHIPFLMLTALSDDDSRLKSYQKGVNGFLVKPFTKDMLEARIDNILSERKMLQDELSYNLENSYAKVNIDRSDKAFMEHLLEVLKNNYADQEFNVPKLLENMCMSMTPFYKKVTSLIGLTPALLIRRYRLQTAKTLMEKSVDSGVSVSEIAYMVGFSDPKYFSKCFQKEFHVRPMDILQK